MFLISCSSCLCPIHWSQVLSGPWRCSWSSADRRCSYYIWVINNFIAYWGVACIRGSMVVIKEYSGVRTRRVKVYVYIGPFFRLQTTSILRPPIYWQLVFFSTHTFLCFCCHRPCLGLLKFSANEKKDMWIYLIYIMPAEDLGEPGHQ